MIDRDLYLQFCISYRKNYECNMPCGINWMYYAYMSLRVLLHYGMEIISECIYFILFRSILRISIV